jgi:hypothetical protein
VEGKHLDLRHVAALAVSGGSADLWSLLLDFQKEARLAEVGILGPADRRRIWSAQEKAALLAEIDAEGVR